MSIKEEAWNKIVNLNSFLKKERIRTSSIEEKIYNYEFSVDLDKNKFKVQVYFGKKGIKTIIQGNEKSPAYNKIRNMIFEESQFDFANSEIEEPLSYIGSDECGKGDFFGPLIVGAVFVDEVTQKKLKAIGVRDSKDLTENQIQSISKNIKQIIGSNYEVVQINPAKYNQLYEQFKNLNKLLDWAHSKAVDNLLITTGCKTVITDKFSNKDLKVSFLSSHNNVEFIQSHKAERFVGVAAASILARDALNQWFINNKIDNIELPKGSSQQVEIAAQKLIDSKGYSTLTDFAKLHFKTTQKLKSNKTNYNS